MTQTDYQKKYEHLLSRTAAMFVAEEEFVSGLKKNYNEPAKKVKLQRLKSEVQGLVRTGVEEVKSKQAEIF